MKVILLAISLSLSVSLASAFAADPFAAELQAESRRQDREHFRADQGVWLDSGWIAPVITITPSKTYVRAMCHILISLGEDGIVRWKAGPTATRAEIIRAKRYKKRKTQKKEPTNNPEVTNNQGVSKK